MSSPSSTNDLHAEHWPSLQPCMSMIPCSAAARRTVWSSPISISIPTGSNRTTCLSAMAPSRTERGLRTGQEHRTERGAGGRGHRPPAVRAYRVRYRLVLRRGTAGRALADVVRVERGPLFRCHLVEQHVRAEHRTHLAQVVQRPHLLGVKVQMRLRDHGLAVVTHVTHVLH